MSPAEATRAEKLDARLRSALTVSRLEINDQSHLHAGHAGAKEGKSHFHIVIQADEFANKSMLQKHKLVYHATGDLMDTDIHALSIEALEPNVSSNG